VKWEPGDNKEKPEEKDQIFDSKKGEGERGKEE